MRWKVAQSEAKEIQSGETPVLSRGTGKQHSALVKEGLVLSILRIHLGGYDIKLMQALPRYLFNQGPTTRGVPRHDDESFRALAAEHWASHESAY